MPKFTPGEWHASPTHSGTAFDIGADDNSNIGLVYADEGNVESHAVGRANARLVIKSPDTFRLLGELLDCTPGSKAYYEKLAEARALLADIEGE